MKKSKILVLLLVVVIIFSGCAAPKAKINISYLGHSSFVIDDNGENKIIIDLWKKNVFPYAEDLPQDLELTDKDITGALITHKHLDHLATVNDVEDVTPKDYEVEAAVGNFKITKYETLHFSDNEMANALISLKSEAMQIVHMGDAFGTMEDKEKLEELKAKLGVIDMLLMPIGSAKLDAVDFEILKNTMDILMPKIIVPIHYWSLEDKQDFLAKAAEAGYSVVDKKENKVSINKDEASDATKTIWSITPGEYSSK